MTTAPGGVQRRLRLPYARPEVENSVADRGLARADGTVSTHPAQNSMRNSC